jgi:hypothetical protein
MRPIIMGHRSQAFAGTLTAQNDQPKTIDASETTEAELTPSSSAGVEDSRHARWRARQDSGADSKGDNWSNAILHKSGKPGDENNRGFTPATHPQVAA